MKYQQDQHVDDEDDASMKVTMAMKMTIAMTYADGKVAVGVTCLMTRQLR